VAIWKDSLQIRGSFISCSWTATEPKMSQPAINEKGSLALTIAMKLVLRLAV